MLISSYNGRDMHPCLPLGYTTDSVSNQAAWRESTVNEIEYSASNTVLSLLYLHDNDLTISRQNDAGCMSEQNISITGTSRMSDDIFIMS